MIQRDSRSDVLKRRFRIAVHRTWETLRTRELRHDLLLHSREYRAVHKLLTTVPYWQPGLTVTVRIVRSSRALWLVASSWRDASTAGVRIAPPVSVLTLLWLTADSLPALLSLLFLLRDMVLFAQQRYVALLPILCSANTDCVVCRCVECSITSSDQDFVFSSLALFKSFSLLDGVEYPLPLTHAHWFMILQPVDCGWFPPQSPL